MYTHTPIDWIWPIEFFVSFVCVFKQTLHNFIFLFLNNLCCFLLSSRVSFAWAFILCFHRLFFATTPRRIQWLSFRLLMGLQMLVFFLLLNLWQFDFYILAFFVDKRKCSITFGCYFFSLSDGKKSASVIPHNKWPIKTSSERKQTKSKCCRFNKFVGIHFGFFFTLGK